MNCRVDMEGSENIYIGTSGWHYEHWKGPFYAEDLPKSAMLSYYSRHFKTVEINNSFYQLPKKETLADWRQTVPGPFIFAVKASRYITHMKKLRDPGETITGLLEAVAALGSKLGPILFQLPPRWKINSARLREFLNALPHNVRYAFEFRDPSWFEDRIFKILNQWGAAFCIYDLAGRLAPKEITADLMVLGKIGRSLPGLRQSGSTVRMVVSQRRGMTFILQSGVRLTLPVVVLFDGTPPSQKGLDIAGLLFRAGDGRLSVFVLADDKQDARDLQLQVMQRLQPHGLGADFRLLVQPSLKGLAKMIGMESSGPVVLPCEMSPLEGEKLCGLVDELANPVLLVR